MDGDPHNNIGRQCNVAGIRGVRFKVVRFIKNPFESGGTDMYVLTSLDGALRMLAWIPKIYNLY